MATVTGTKKSDSLLGTNGVDTITGGAGRDDFFFVSDPPNWDSKRSTLDNNDRITDYEFGERISISGVRLNSSSVTLHYDSKNGRTELRLDLDNDGKVDRTVLLDGDQRGRIQVDTNCCATPTTDITINKSAGTTTLTQIDVTGANFIDTFGLPTHTGGPGIDIFDVRGGADTVFGGAGNDIISGGDGNDILNGGGDDDLIGGDGGNDIIRGDGGNDQLLGMGGDDILEGGAGNDFLRGGPGSDTMSGGTGDDIFGFLEVTDFGPTNTLKDYEFGELIDLPDDPGLRADFQLLDGVGRTNIDFTGDGTNDAVIILEGVSVGKAIIENGEGLRIYNPSTAGTAGNDMINLTGSGHFVDGGQGFDQIMIDRGRDGLNTSCDEMFNFVRGLEFNLALDNVEAVHFTDAILRFDVDGNAGQAYRAYQAGLDRKPDEGGLGFWVKGMDAGTFTLFSMAANIIQSAEFIAKYGTSETVTNTAFINLLYNNVLGRNGDEGGLTHWNGQLESGVGRETLLANFADSAENKARVECDISDGIWLV